MVNARDFTNDQTAIFAKTLVWRTELDRLGELIPKLAITDSAEAILWLDDLDRYGWLMIELVATNRGHPKWLKLQHDAAMLAHSLAERAAKAEVEAQRHVVAE